MSRQLQVLLVDDEPDVRMLVRVLLGSEDMEIHEAATGSGALKALADGPIDLVVLDWMMPGVSGLEVLQRIRSDERLAGVPVVMLTGISEDRLPEAVKAGADWIVTKPFVEEDLLEAIHSLFPQRRPVMASVAQKRAERGGPDDTWIDLRG